MAALFLALGYTSALLLCWPEMMDRNPHKVHFFEISPDEAGQRVDNFIRARYPALPKSRIYQMLRKGEVRRNGKRIKPLDRVCAGDVLRLPPIVDAQKTLAEVPAFWCERVAGAVLFEDADFLIVNKPPGIAVHAGSRQPYGLIDAVQRVWGEGYAELAHRLDAETSGCLVLGKHRAALAAFREAAVDKYYWALVNDWDASVGQMRLFLAKSGMDGQERMVVDTVHGKEAITRFRVLRRLQGAVLLEVQLLTGRTHQIRVSVQQAGFAIGGDDRYGDFAFNRVLRGMGFRGMFLHARSIAFSYEGRNIAVQAPLPHSAQRLLDQLEDI